MAASPYPAYGPAGERGTRRPGKRSAAGQDDGSVAKEPIAAVDQRCQHGEERRIFQRIAKMVGAQRQMGGQGVQRRTVRGVDLLAVNEYLAVNAQHPQAAQAFQGIALLQDRKSHLADTAALAARRRAHDATG